MTMSPSSPPAAGNSSSRLSRLFTSRRRTLLTALVALLVAAGVVIGVTDPFRASGQSGSGVSDNPYPTSVATVTRQALSSQTQVNATLGYGGSVTVSVPSGVAASTVDSDQASVRTDNAKLAADEKALSSAKALAGPDNAATLLGAKAAVSSDEKALAQAETQLSSDRRLSCPAASSATVTTASASSSPSSGSGSSGSGTSASSGAGSGNSSSSSSSTKDSTPAGTTGSSAPSGNTGGSSANELSAFSAKPVKQVGAPVASTGSVDSTTSKSTVLMGSVNPNGATTTYYFEYGTSADYGQTTTAKKAPAGAPQIAVTLKLSGLTPGQVYYYRLVAKNSVGTSYGQQASFQTTAPPSAVTLAGATVTESSETLSGTVNPGGLATTFYFEWGRDASYGRRTHSEDAGAGSSAISVSALASGLKPDTTYIFRLVAKNSLGTAFGTSVTFQSAESSCVAENQVVNEDAQALKTANDALAADRLGAGSSVASADQTLASDRQTLAAAEQALSADESKMINPETTFTSLPSTGQVLHRGSTVYRLDGQPVPLFYGTVVPDRALYLGVSDGPDVAQLQENLIALGFGSAISPSTHFSTATEQAVKAWQASLGVAETGVVALGDFVLEPSSIQVDTVSASLGQTVQPGSAVLTATSTARVVTISLDAAEQSEVKVGDPVTITLPNNATTPGVVSSVGTVATSSSSGGGNTGSGSSSTITVDVTPTDPAATGTYDQAPVEVSITNASVSSALVVPVDALLALAGGGYALEEIGAGKVHHLVPVSLGLFDDADGLVQVSGAGVAAGQRLVVPAL